MGKFIFSLVSILLLCVPLSAQNAEEFLRAAARTQSAQAQWSGMRVFLPANQQDNITAYATYLYNMYIWHNMYGTQEENTLSLNYLGVLEGISHFPGLRTRRALDFYRKHQAQIQRKIAFFFDVSRRKYPQDAAQEERWIALLEQQDFRTAHYKLLYTYPAQFIAHPSYVRADVQFLLPAVRMADALAAQQVVLFEQAVVAAEDLDSRLVSGGHHKTQYTYRWVKDECEYSSYLLGKQLLQTAAQGPEKWKQTRLYKITARPADGELYLRPAQEERFVLSDGSASARWQYHTAILLVLNTQEDNFIPLVLDNFLGDAEEPLALSGWAAYFDKSTRFEVTPFTRNPKIEELLQLPDEIIGNGGAVRVNGREYIPAPIIE